MRTKTPVTDASAYDSRDGRRTPVGNVVDVYTCRRLELERDKLLRREKRFRKSLDDMMTLGVAWMTHYGRECYGGVDHPHHRKMVDRAGKLLGTKA